MAVTLTKSSPTVSLKKADISTGVLRVNLNWDQTGGAQKKTGWRSFFDTNTGIDLDLAALIEMQNGEKGVIQALGNSFGDFDNYPYIKLDKDDRTGSSTDGENIMINLAHQDDFKRICIFTFIYQGAPSWDRAKGVVTLHPASGQPIQINIDEYASGKILCGVAMLENDGNGLSIRRIVEYFNGHDELDRRFGWGMQWVAGSKD